MNRTNYISKKNVRKEDYPITKEKEYLQEESEQRGVSKGEISPTPFLDKIMQSQKSKYFIPQNYFIKTQKGNYSGVTIYLKRLVDKVDVMPTPLEELTLEEVKNLSSEKKEYYKQEAYNKLEKYRLQLEEKKHEEVQKYKKKIRKSFFEHFFDLFTYNWEILLPNKEKREKRFSEIDEEFNMINYFPALYRSSDKNKQNEKKEYSL